MKKFLFGVLILSVLLVACDKNDPPVTVDPVVTTKNPVITAPQATVKMTEEPLVTTFEDPVALETVKPDLGNDVDINYEVLLTEDEELNALLERAAAAEMARYIPNASSITADGGRADYSVVMADCYVDETIVAASFTGEYSIYYADGAGDEYSGEVFYTVLIDPVSKKILQSDDIVSDFDKLKQAFSEGRFTAMGTAPYATDIAQYRTEYGIYPYVSLDAENFYLYITDSGMDEYTTCYSIPRQDASDFLKF